MDSRKLALLCRDLAENKKAENIVVLDVRKISTITDYFVIASGGTEPHLRAIADSITDGLREDHSLRPHSVDGAVNTSWRVVDYIDVIVHIMRNDVRSKYDLETLWGDAPRVTGAEEEEPTVEAPKAPKKSPRAGTAVKPKARKPKATQPKPAASKPKARKPAAKKKKTESA